MNLMIDLYNHWWNRKELKLLKYCNGGKSFLNEVGSFVEAKNIFDCRKCLLCLVEIVDSYKMNSVIFNEKWFIKLCREIRSWLMLVDCVISRTFVHNSDQVIDELVCGDIDLDKASAFIGDF